MTDRRRPPRAEDDPVFQARRQAADERADALRRRSLLMAILWFCAFQLFGAAILASALHVTSIPIGKALLALALFVGDAGSILAVWWVYVRRERRGDW